MGFSFVTGLESIVHADNASFDGTSRGGAMTTNAQLWIGSTAARHVKVGTLTSPDSSITFGYSSPNITAMVNRAVVDHYMPNYIVDGAAKAGYMYTTIGAAITQAVADGFGPTNPCIIGVRPVGLLSGGYAENVVVPSMLGVQFIGYGNADDNNASVYLNGTFTAQASSTCYVDNFNFSSTVAMSANLWQFDNCTFQGAVTGVTGKYNYCNFTSTVQDGIFIGCSGIDVTLTNSLSQFYDCINPSINVNAFSFTIASGCANVTVTGTSALQSFLFNSSIVSIASTATVNVQGIGAQSRGNTSISAVTTPNWSVLQNLQGNILTARRVAADTTLTRYDQYIGVVGNVGAVNITLPNTGSAAAKGYNNQVWKIVDEAGTANTLNITLTTNGGTINGAATFVINLSYGAVEVISDGTNYYVI